MKIDNITNKSFFNDCIEIVKLKEIIDGDTAIFKTKKGNYCFRFLGIDCPECTKRIEPFGLKAKQVLEKTISNAKYIVIEADSEPELDSTNCRYLAYVLYGNDLNSMFFYQEEVLKSGLARPLIMNNVNKYNDLLYDANNYAINGHVGIYSDGDPDFPSLEVDSTIEEVLKNDYVDGAKIVTCGIISGFIGNSFYLVDGESSVYVYNSYKLNKQLSIGDKIKIKAQLSRDSVYGLELTNVKLLDIISRNNNLVYPKAILSLDNYIGKIVELVDVKVYKIKSYERAFKLIILHNETQYKVRISSKIPCFDINLFKEGLSFRIIAAISLYRDSFYAESYPVINLLNDYKNTLRENK